MSGADGRTRGRDALRVAAIVIVAIIAFPITIGLMVAAMSAERR